MKQKRIAIAIALLAAVMLVNVDAQASQDILNVTGLQARATNQGSPDGVSTSAYLQVRSGSGGRKSWLQFDLRPLYAEDPSLQGNILDAKLTFGCATSYIGGRRYVVNGLNDAANLENWLAATLTWNNAPGNDTTSTAALDTTKTTFFYQDSFQPDPVTVTTLNALNETPVANRAAVTAFLNTDTDGLVTFILTGGDTTDLYTVGTALAPVLTITYELGNNPKKAHYPIPADGIRVSTTLASLSWTNPEPAGAGSIITCDIYLGTDPNLPKMDKKTVGAGVSTVDINTTNFPNYGTLIEQRQYYWIVDIHDTAEPNVITGQVWKFFVSDNTAPVVDAGADQAVWLNPNEVTVNLDGTVTDDGLPTPPSLTYLWTQVSGPAVTITLDNTVDTPVTLTARGTYEFQLTADDNDLPGSATLQVVVGTSPCDASHLSTGAGFDAVDVNRDCIVDLQDLYLAITEDWLVCTDTLTNCGK